MTTEGMIGIATVDNLPSYGYSIDRPETAAAASVSTAQGARTPSTVRDRQMDSVNIFYS